MAHNIGTYGSGLYGVSYYGTVVITDILSLYDLDIFLFNKEVQTNIILITDTNHYITLGVSDTLALVDTATIVRRSTISELLDLTDIATYTLWLLFPPVSVDLSVNTYSTIILLDDYSATITLNDYITTIYNDNLKI